MSTFKIVPLNAFKDNYIWALVDSIKKAVIVVDPGDAQPVVDFLEGQGLSLQAIIITHHHADHRGGIPVLVEKYSSIVYGPQHPDINPSVFIDELTHIDIPLFGKFTIIRIPGHTLEHTAYYHESGLLFCGDTLFSAGCGRVFEGTYEQMYDSLSQLGALPDDTKIYCGHEYTVANLGFAKAVEPLNIDIQNMLIESEKKRQMNIPTLPSTLSLEKKVNPFLRCEVPAVIATVQTHTGQPLTHPVDIFRELRLWKNSF